MSLKRAFGVAAFVALIAGHAVGDWKDMATVSMTSPNSAKLTNRYLCYTDGSDIACDAPSLYLSTGGLVGVNTTNPQTQLEVRGTISATNFVGDGAGLTNLSVSGDRIVSGTTPLTQVTVISNTRYVSISQGGANSAWFDPMRGLVTLGVSATGPISGSAGYFAGKVGIGTTNPSRTLHVYNSGSFPARFEGPAAAFVELRDAGDDFTSTVTADVKSISLRADGTSSANSLNVFGDDGAGGGEFITANTDGVGRLRITKTGNVGIGTATPSQEGGVTNSTVLHIESPVSNGTAALKLGAPTAGRGNGLIEVGAAGYLSGDHWAWKPTFGVNLAVQSPDGTSTVFYTPVTTTNRGYGGLSYDYWGSAHFYGYYGNTYRGEIVAPVERVTIKGDTGNVGVGTASPDYPLDVEGSARVGSDAVAGNYTLRLQSGGTKETRLTRYSGDNGIMEIRHYGTGAMQFVTHDGAPVLLDGGMLLLRASGSEVVRITSESNVGIGTTVTNPKAALSIGAKGVSDTQSYGAGTVYSQGLLNFYYAQNFPTTNNYDRVLDIVAEPANAGSWMRLFTGEANKDPLARLVITPEGRVGISTSTPNAALEVNGTISATNLIVNGSPVTGSAAAVSGTGAIQFSANGSGTFGGDAANLYWDDTNKRLGIGVATPSYKLHVVNGSNAVAYLQEADTSTVAFNNNALLNLRNNNTTDNNWSELAFTSGAGLVAAGIGAQMVSQSSHYGDLAFFTRGSGGWGERMRVTGDGKVGIGTSSPLAAFKFDVDTVTNNTVAIAARASTDGTTGFISLGTYNGNGYVSAGDGAFGSRDLILRAAAEGIETEYVRIKGLSGNVGIGTTNPNAKLDVVGTISASDAIQVSGSSLTCSSAIKGAMRYSNTSSTIEYCQGTAWTSLGPSATDVPAFSAKRSANLTVTPGLQQIPYDSELFDTINGFDAAGTHRFTPTVAGKYIVNVGLGCNSSANCQVYIYKNGTAMQRSIDYEGATNSNRSAGVSGIIEMNGTTDYLEGYGYTNGTVFNGGADTYFSAALIASGNGLASGGGASALNDLTDVNTSGAAAGKVLRYDGSSWVVSDSGGAIASLSDVQLTGLSGRDYLRYDAGSSKWVNISESTVMSTTTMVDGWPDAIVCTLTNPNWGLVTFYPFHMPYVGNGKYTYRNNNGTSNYDINFNADKSFSGYQNISAANCNKSIATLYTDGQAFNYIGNNGSGSSSAAAVSSTGAIQFSADGAGAFGGDTANLFWDNANKRLGIGTASPGAGLEVAGGESGSIIARFRRADGTALSSDITGAGAQMGMSFYATSTPTATTAWALGRGSGGSFQIGNGANTLYGATKQLTIDPFGKVGIGTESPIAPLTVGGVTSSGQFGAYGAIISGPDEATGALTASGSHGASLLLKDSLGLAGNGGALLFGANAGHDRFFAGIKGLLYDGNNYTAGHIAFSTRNGNADAALTERMRIMNTGNVGIGTTSPNQGKVEVKGGSVCVDTNSDDNATQCIASESDARLKTNVKPLENSLEKIVALRGVSFDWRVSDTEVLKHYPLLARFSKRPHSVGLIAQEVQKVVPEAIEEETVGDKEVQYMQLDYTKLVPLLIEGVKELKAANDVLVSRTIAAEQALQAANDNYQQLRREVEALKAAR